MRNILKKNHDYICKDYELSVFVCAYVILDALNSTVQVAFGISGSALSTFKIISQGLLFILLICSIHKMPVTDFFKVVLTEIIGVFVCVYSYLLGASLSSIMNWGKEMVMVFLPLCIATYLIRDKSVLYRMLLKCSWGVLAISIVNYFNSTEVYDMHFSYSILLLILLHINEFTKSKKKFYLLTAIIEFLMMIIHGSRGALVCVLVFVCLKIITSNADSRRKTVLVLLSISIFVMLYIAFKSYATAIYAILQKLGIDGRTIRMLFSGDFSSHDGGRYELWDKTISLIKENPLAGWGMSGAVNELLSVGYYGAAYPHQLFLDLVMSFGIPIGLVLSIILVWKLRYVFIPKQSDFRDLIQIMTSISFVSLMFTGTFFTNFQFYLLLGLLCSKKYETHYYSVVRE